MADPYQARRAMLKFDILARVSGGESVRAICREPGMPSARTVSDWGRADPRFRQDLWAAGQRRAARQSQKPQQLRGPRRVKTPRPWDEAVADQVLIRVMNGAELKTLGQTDPDLPGRGVLARWRREQPDFDAELRFAIRHRMRRHGRAAQSCAALSEAIVDGIVGGASLHSLSRQPGMPSDKTLYRWFHQRPAFRAEIDAACRDREDIYIDRIVELARAITPANHVAVARQISLLKRQLGRLRHRPGWKRR